MAGCDCSGRRQGAQLVNMAAKINRRSHLVVLTEARGHLEEGHYMQIPSNPRMYADQIRGKHRKKKTSARVGKRCTLVERSPGDIIYLMLSIHTYDVFGTIANVTFCHDKISLQIELTYSFDWVLFFSKTSAMTLH